MEPIYIFAGILLVIAPIFYIVHLNGQKRIAEFEKIAMVSGDIYQGKQSKAFYDRVAMRGHQLFSRGYSRRVRHLFEVPFKHGWMGVFEYQYTTSSGENSSTYHYHAVMIESDALPTAQFSVKREWFIHQIKPTLGMTTKDIDFEMSPEFSERFFLEGEDETAVRSAFSDEVIRWFENMPAPYEVGMQNGGLLLYAKGKLRHEWVETLKRDGATLHDRLSRSSKTGKFDGGWDDKHDWWG